MIAFPHPTMPVESPTMNLWYPDMTCLMTNGVKFHLARWIPVSTSFHRSSSTSNPEFEAGPVHGSRPLVVAIALKMRTSQRFKRAWMQMISAWYNLGRSRGSTARNLRNANMTLRCIEDNPSRTNTEAIAAMLGSL